MSGILCINTGSSTVKYGFYRGDQSVASGQTGSGPGFSAQQILKFLPEKPEAIVHRLVHGGDLYFEATEIDSEVLSQLHKLESLAPEHMPLALEVIAESLKEFPDIPQYACFDTGFHNRMPDLAKQYPLPKYIRDKGVRKFGFHGLSYESIVTSLGDRIPEKLVIAHLGNGSSLCALRNGIPVDTTMGFTPAGGVMMGSRTGDIDPGVITWLQRECGLDNKELDRMFNHDSGLLGLSGLDSDMQKLCAAAVENPQAAFATEKYCYEIRKTIGAFAAVLGGLDLLVFTGGIGENSAEIRNQITDGLGFLQCDVEAIATNESLTMARQVEKLLADKG